jgi:hypothetical protein
MTTDNINQEIFEFLDDLRETGQMNMFGAAPLIREVFGITRRRSQIVLSEWMCGHTARGSLINI